MSTTKNRSPNTTFYLLFFFFPTEAMLFDNLHCIGHWASLRKHLSHSIIMSKRLWTINKHSSSSISTVRNSIGDDVVYKNLEGNVAHRCFVDPAANGMMIDLFDFHLFLRRLARDGDGPGVGHHFDRQVVPFVVADFRLESHNGRQKLLVLLRLRWRNLHRRRTRPFDRFCRFP